MDINYLTGVEYEQDMKFHIKLKFHLYSLHVIVFSE